MEAGIRRPWRDAREALPGWLAGPERVVRVDPGRRHHAPARRGAVCCGAEEINIGGIHHGPVGGRVLRYVFLSDRRGDGLRRAVGAGATVLARDVPGARGVGLGELVDGR